MSLRRPALARAILLALVLLAAGEALAVSIPGPDFVRRRLEETTARAVEGEARFGRIAVQPFDGSVEVWDVVVRPGFGAVRELRLDHGRLRVALGELASGQLRILGLAADGLTVRMEPRPRAGPAAPGPLFDARILERLQDVSVARGSVHFLNEAIEFEIDARGIVVGSRAAGGGPGLSGNLSAGPIRFRSRGIPEQVIDRARLEWTWSAPRIRFRDLDASGPGGRVRGDGFVSLTSQGILVAGKLDADLDVARVAPDLSPSVRGYVNVQADYRVADPGGIALAGRFASRGSLTVGGRRIDGTTGRFAIDDAGARVSELALTTAGGTRVDRLDLDAPAAGGLRLASEGEADVAELLALVDAGPRAAQLHGRARYRLTAAQPPGGALSWELDADVAAGGLPGATGALSGRLEARSGPAGGRARLRGALDLSRVDLDVGWPAAGFAAGWTVTGRLAAPRGPASHKARAALLRYLDDERIELPAGTVPRFDGPVEVDVALRGRGDALLEGDLPFRAEAPTYGALPLDRLEGRLRLGPGAFRIDLRLADAEGAGVVATVAAAPDEPVSVDAAAERLPLPVLREYVKGAFEVDLPPMTGTLDGSASGFLPETGPDIAFRGRALGVLDGVGRVDLHADGLWRGERVDVAWSDLAIEGVAARFAGAIRLPGDTLPWGVEGRVDADLDLAGLAPLLGDVEGAGRVHVETELRFAGPGAPLVADGRAAWRGVQLAGLALPDGYTRAVPLPDGTKLQVRTDALAGDVALRGPCADPALEAHFRWRDLDVLRLASIVRRAPVPVALDVLSDGTLELRGRARHPEGWTGSGRLARLDLLAQALDGRLENPVEVTIPGDGWVRFAGHTPLVLLGPAGGRIEATGGVALLGERGGELDLRVAGNADLNMLEVLHPDLLAAGAVQVDLALTGPFSAPRIGGRARVAGGRVRVLPYADAVDSLEADVEFGGLVATITKASFRVGGGRVTVGGVVRLENGLPERLELRVLARSVALNVPKDAWGRYDADLQVSGPVTEPVVSGRVVMLAGRYTRQFSLDPFGARTRKLDPVTSRAHWASRLGLNVQVTAADTLAVRNDLARMQAGLSLEVTGDAGVPLVEGSVVFLEGGRLTFRGIDYEVISGQLVMDDPRGEPIRVQLRARTEVSGYDIRLDLDATMETLDYQLTSVPSLSRSEILTLLLTGKDPSESSGSSTSQVSSEMAAGYFGSQLGELLLAAPAKRLLGVSRFQLSPSDVGAGTDPVARVTIGKRLGDDTTVLYSRDLSAEGRDVYRLEHDLSRRLRIAIGREDTGGNAVDLRWLKRFGERRGAADGGAPGGGILEDVRIEGLPPDVAVRTRKDLRLRVGRRTLPYQVVEARDALRGRLAEEGYLQAEVTASAQRRDDGAPGAPPRGDVVFTVVPGPRWTFVEEGPPGRVRDARRRLEEYWAGTEFRPGEFRQEERVLLEALADEGYAAAIVAVGRPDAARPELRLKIDPGPKLEVESVAFEGVSALPLADVEEQVLSRPPGGISQITGPITGADSLYRPRLVADDAAAIETLYAQRGYLEVRVETQVRYSADGEKARLTFIVREGAQARVGRLRVDGWPERLGSATARLSLRPGAPFELGALKAAESALRAALDDAGYWRAGVASRIVAGASAVDVTFRVRPGEPATVGEVRYIGLDTTRRKLVARATHVVPGAPLSSAAVRRTESDLFKLGLFRRVDVEPVPSPTRPGVMDVVVQIDENPELSLLLSAGYDTEESFRGGATLSNDNLWGLGRNGSFQVYGSNLRLGARATLEDRHLRRDRLEGLATVYYEREDNPGFGLQTIGGSLQFSTPIREQTRWQVRYQLEDNEYYDVTIDPDAIEDVLEEEGQRLAPVRLGGVLGTFIRDRRNDPFVPSSGWVFTSEAGVWARPLFSEETFARVTGQVTVYYPRRRLTLVASGRIGFAWPYGETEAVPLPQRFFAGGSDSLRAWERDTVGPTDASGDPLGGESLLVANLEARYRITDLIQASLFYDVGNVWETASDFFRGDLRNGIGAGLRFVTPVGALRLEYAWKLDRLTCPAEGPCDLPGGESESPGQFFFSIGEPF